MPPYYSQDDDETRQLNGHVSISWQSGHSYEGNYVAGQRFGLGTMRYPDGAVYEGYWYKDLRSGKGVLTLPDGKQLECLFEEDSYVDPETGKTITLP